MKKKDTSNLWWSLSLILAIAASLVAGYFWGASRRIPPVLTETVQEAPEPEPQTPPEVDLPIEEEVPVLEPEDLAEEILPSHRDVSRSQIEQGVRDFFSYLDGRNYVQRLDSEMGTYDRFKKLVTRLASDPPIPAGEGMDLQIMYKNIFLFFRLLDREDLRLILGIMRNEADSLEMNLDLFYRWLMLDRAAGDPEGFTPPSLEVKYQYAGFFLNTIGGRAYLFRRNLGLRLLVSYYCLLVIHEADKKGKNTYGIDIFPLVTQIEKEMALYPDFHFKQEYLQALRDMETYYLERR